MYPLLCMATVRSICSLYTIHLVEVTACLLESLSLEGSTSAEISSSLISLCRSSFRNELRPHNRGLVPGRGLWILVQKCLPLDYGRNNPQQEVQIQGLMAQGGSLSSHDQVSEQSFPLGMDISSEGRLMNQCCSAWVHQGLAGREHYPVARSLAGLFSALAETISWNQACLLPRALSLNQFPGKKTKKHRFRFKKERKKPFPPMRTQSSIDHEEQV